MPDQDRQWIGIAISPPQDQQEDWFTEGVTDYLTNLVQVGNGLIPEQMKKPAPLPDHCR